MIRALLDLAKDLLQIGLGVFPFPTRTGLIRIGDPGRGSPVFLTCNFDLTVRRVRRALRGLDCYLLVAPSRGINVWCAAGGGYLTANEVVSVIKTSGVSDMVDHRRLVLPQLAATGVERRDVEERTGWRAVFGPVRAEDIPAYLADHYKKAPEMSTVRFDLPDRLKMAAMWAFPTSIVVLPPLLIWWRGLVPMFLATIWGIASLMFVAIPWLPWDLAGDNEEGAHRQPGNLSFRIVAFVGTWVRAGLPTLAVYLAALAAYVQVASDWGWPAVIGWGLSGFAITLLLGIELLGSTPIYKSGMHEERLLTVRLVEDRCTGRAICEQVCPKGRFRVDNKRHKAEIIDEQACVQCGACVVQCTEDALLFAFPDGRTIPPEEIRRYKLNLLGERTRVP